METQKNLAHVEMSAETTNDVLFSQMEDSSEEKQKNQQDVISIVSIDEPSVDKSGENEINNSHASSDVVEIDPVNIDDFFGELNTESTEQKSSIVVTNANVQAEEQKFQQSNEKELEQSEIIDLDADDSVDKCVLDEKESVDEMITHDKTDSKNLENQKPVLKELEKNKNATNDSDESHVDEGDSPHLNAKQIIGIEESAIIDLNADTANELKSENEKKIEVAEKNDTETVVMVGEEKFGDMNVPNECPSANEEKKAVEITISDSSDESDDLVLEKKSKVDCSVVDEKLQQYVDSTSTVAQENVLAMSAVESNEKIVCETKSNKSSIPNENLMEVDQSIAMDTGATNNDCVDVFELMKENEHLFDASETSSDVDQQKKESVSIQDTANDIGERSGAPLAEIKAIQRIECINVDCKKSSKIYHNAPEFIINHFHLKKPQKIMYVCDDCFNESIEKYAEMCAKLNDKQPLLIENIKYSGLVEVIDSSDDEDEGDSSGNNNQREHKQFDGDTLTLIEEELEVVIKNTFEKINIEQQMDWNRQYLAAKIENNRKMSDGISNELKAMQKNVDKMYLETYSFRSTLIEEVPSLDLTTGNPTQIANEFYPPIGELVLLPLNSHSLYYSFQKKQTACWHPCKFEKEIDVNGEMLNVIKFLRMGRSDIITKQVPRKHLAYGRTANFRLNVGTRVIALSNYNENTETNKRVPMKNKFYPGVIAEPLKSYTKWRYLVFYDDGYVRYVQHEDVRIVCEQSERVWELIETESTRNFIEDYIKNFKQKRPIVQAQVGQKMHTEYNGQWFSATVKSTDGSLVQMQFDTISRVEWIYRGSTRLHPLFKRLNGTIQAASANRNETKIEFIVIDDDKEPVRTADTPSSTIGTPIQTPTQNNRKFATQAIRDTPQQRDQKRAVAKKSTAVARKPAVQHMNNSTIYVDEDKPKGKVVYYTAKKHIEPKKFIPHDCNPGCLIQITHNLKPYSPLSKPLLSGWERQICRTKLNKKVVVYRGPCGRRFRDISEVHKYLRMTECPLNVENFDYDPLLHCLAEYVIDSYVMRKADLSEGVEQMPVSCVNSYDNSEPPPCIYSNIRTPTEGVNLNLDPEFLCGCDCTDDCLDKTKCQCWQLTLAGAKYGNPDTPTEKVGYEFKRLYEHIPLGIYECNSRCKCKSNCLNRVVQHQLQIKLQVFKTVNRGWGIRCLNDIPKGSFVCCYAGNLLTEQNANDAGENLGDEYFAELDYIEVVSSLKEGYEDCPEPPDLAENNSSADDEDFDVENESLCTQNDTDSDDYEFVSRHYESNDSIKKKYRTRNSVDTRKKHSSITSAVEIENQKDRNTSSDEDETRQQKNFMASNTMPDDPDDEQNKSIRALFGKDEAVYVMDAKKTGNIGRYFNHSCGPNLFVQNVFVDTHDIRFPWVAFFAMSHIRAGTELTWNYNYEVGSVKGKVLICQCGDANCRGRIL